MIYTLLKDSFLNRYSKCFQQMDIVEDEIQKFIEKYPERKEYLYNSFMVFSHDSSLFLDYDLVLWRHHVSEILDRIGRNLSKKEERELATTAETLIAFSLASLKSPITHDGTNAFFKLFIEVYGENSIQNYANQFDVDTKYESFSGAIDQLIAYAKKAGSRERYFPTNEDIIEKRQRDIENGNTEALKYSPTFQASLL